MEGNSHFDVRAADSVGIQGSFLSSNEVQEVGNFNGYTVVYSDIKEDEPIPTSDPLLMTEELVLPEHVHEREPAQVAPERAATQKSDIPVIVDRSVEESMESVQSEELEDMEGDFDLEDIDEIEEGEENEAVSEEKQKMEKKVSRFISRLNKHQSPSKYKGLMQQLKEFSKHSSAKEALEALKGHDRQLADLLDGQGGLDMSDLILAFVKKEFPEITEQHNFLECFQSHLKDLLKSQKQKDPSIASSLKRVQEAIARLTSDATAMARIRAGYDLIPKLAEQLPSPHELREKGFESVETLNRLILDQFLDLKGDKRGIFDALCGNLMTNRLKEWERDERKASPIVRFKKNVELLKSIFGRELKAVTTFMGGMSVIVSIRETLQVASQIDSVYHLIAKSLKDTKHVA